MSEAAVLVAVLLLTMIAAGTQKVLFLPDDARLLICYELLGGTVLLMLPSKDSTPVSCALVLYISFMSLLLETFSKLC
jgi:FtsH-binding integral membrane protein